MTNVIQSAVSVLLCQVLFAVAASHGKADSLHDYVYVPRAAIYPGDTIGADALVAVPNPFGATNATTFGSRPEEVVGKVARRTLVAGKPIPASAVREQSAVIQGRSYDIIYKAGALTISGVAVPLKSAAVGEVVNVRNPESGIVVQATVQPGGTLLVKSP